MQSGINESEYIDLVFERIDDASVLSNFYCGIQDMDNFIHEKLQGYLSRTDCEAYAIKIGDDIVAMLSLGEDTLCLDEDDKEAYKTIGYSAVGFYSHCDFTPAEPPLGYKDTLRMYKVLHPIWCRIFRR